MDTTMDVDGPVLSECCLPQQSPTKPYIEHLYSNEPKKCFHGVVELKFAVIGSPRCKANVIEQGCVARLLQILRAPDTGLLLKTEVVTVLNSLAKGLPEHAASLVQAGVLPVLWEQLEACGHCNTHTNASQCVVKVSFNKNTNENGSSSINNGTILATTTQDNNNSSSSCCVTNKRGRTQLHSQQHMIQHQRKLVRIISNYTQMLLCCLRSVYRQGCVPPPPSWNHKLLSTLIKYGYHPPTNQECVANILAYACKTAPASTSLLESEPPSCEEQQLQLVSAGAGSLVAAMLSSTLTKVQLPALHCLSALAKNNREVSSQLCVISERGIAVPDRLVQLLGCHAEPAVQLGAATALVWLHRGNALPHSDTRICNKTIQSLVRLCASDRPGWLRVEAARQLAHLTELSPELQRTAAITDHLLTSLKDFLDYTPADGELAPRPEQLSPCSCGQFDELTLLPELMRESGLLVFASLAANNEEIRQKIVSGHTLLDTVTSTLSTGNPAVKLASIRCLQSLSRSVHTLRTTFQDHLVWKPLLALVQDSKTDPDMMIVSLSTICNLTLEFSPSKEHILEQGCISHLCSLTRKDNYDLKLNSVWALMNIAFQSDLSIKKAILLHLGADQLFSLISDSEIPIMMKALGLLRNLLSNRQDIDTIMRQHGNQVMQSVILILEGQYTTQVKEQALCILSNIADGDQAKESIIGNEDVLKKLFNYMLIPKIELQLAATSCIGTLVAAEDPNSIERQVRLREAKAEEILESLLSTENPNLYEKVRFALAQFKASIPAISSSSSSSSTTSASNGSPSASSTPASQWRPLDQGQ